MAWTGPDLAWAGACRSAWVAPGCVTRLGRTPSAAPGSRLCRAWVRAGDVGWAADRKREREERRKEEKEEGREREKKREVRERGRRERGKEKFRVCSGFSEVETQLYSVRVFRKTREITDLTFF